MLPKTNKEIATEIRVRAQRRAGEMLAVTEKQNGARGIGKKVELIDTTPLATLSDMGITKDQSSNWQTLAAMSDEHFEATVEAAKDTAGEVTTAFMLRKAKRSKLHELAAQATDPALPAGFFVVWC